MRTEPTTSDRNTHFAALIHAAVTEPGVLADCYKLFHSYSPWNVFWAMGQALALGIEVGPLSTYKRWKALGRTVKKGSKAIFMTMPRLKFAPDPEDPTKKIPAGQYFISVPRWFFLSQTDGPDVAVEAGDSVQWDKNMALKALEITEETFSLADGNCGGYAHVTGDKKGTIAVNPVHPHPYRIYFHEMAHVLLHSETETVKAEDRPPSNIRELEAELTAYICTQTLGLGGASESRGYLQHWYSHKAVPETSAKSVCETAAKILAAGQSRRQ
jgi:antirestriction protein ArdC